MGEQNHSSNCIHYCHCHCPGCKQLSIRSGILRMGRIWSRIRTADPVLIVLEKDHAAGCHRRYGGESESLKGTLKRADVMNAPLTSNVAERKRSLNLVY